MCFHIIIITTLKKQKQNKERIRSVYVQFMQCNIMHVDFISCANSNVVNQGFLNQYW